MNIHDTGVSTAPKLIAFNSDAQLKVYGGIKELADAVKCTMGPAGRVVTSARYEGLPTLITKDGVSVAREISFSDPYMNQGATLLKDIAMRANDTVGDGTTTATVLADAMLELGFEYLEEASNHNACFGLNKLAYLTKRIFTKGLVDTLKTWDTQYATPIDIKHGAEVALDFIKHEISCRTIDCTDGMLYDVAMVSANGDTKIAELCAEAIKTVGADGMVNLARATGHADEFIRKEGLVYDAGMAHIDWRDTDLVGTSAVLDKPLVAVVDGEMKHNGQFTPMILDLVANLQRTENVDPKYKNRPILIICNGFDNSVIQAINLMRDGQKIKHNLVQMQGYGEHRTGLMKDLVSLTGGKVIGGASGIVPKNIDELVEALCEPETVNLSMRVTQVIHADLEEINSAKKEISDTLDTLISDGDMNGFRREQLKSRQAILGCGIGEIKLVGLNDLDYRERHDRLEDAINATRAAKRGGVIGGGGAMLHNLADDLIDAIRDKRLNLNERANVGALLLAEAIKRPYKQILENAWEDSEELSHRLSQAYAYSFNAHIGYDMKTKTFVDMGDIKIYDPVYVTLSSLENSMNVAILVLTSGATIVHEQRNQATL